MNNIHIKFYVLIFAFLFLGSYTRAQDKNELLNNLLQSIPSPLEISTLIKNTGVQYDAKMLNSASNVRKYNTDFKKAFNLGVYSTDLGYVNIYQKKDTVAMSYLSAIVNISDGLKIDKLIDFAEITQYTLSNNLNGLLAETSNSFEKINKYLLDNQKPELSVLILTGAWLETLYLTCQVAKQFPNKVLDDRIAEQKIILDKILPMLSSYNKNTEITSLITDLTQLSDVFKKIKINQKVKADENYRVEMWGTLEVIIFDGEDNNKNAPKYKPEDLANILKVSSVIRLKMVN